MDSDGIQKVCMTKARIRRATSTADHRVRVDPIRHGAARNAPDRGRCSQPPRPSSVSTPRGMQPTRMRGRPRLRTAPRGARVRSARGTAVRLLLLALLVLLLVLLG